MDLPMQSGILCFISIQTHLRLLNILSLKFFDLEMIWPSYKKLCFQDTRNFLETF